MIEAKELRIGNMVKYCASFVQITSVPKIKLKTIYFNFGSNKNYCAYIKEISPILITEEWLKNFGFEEINGGDMVIFKRQDSNWFIKWSNERHRYLLGYTLPLGVHSIRNWRTLDTYFTYFHELQNFYSSIGEELTFSAI